MYDQQSQDIYQELFRIPDEDETGVFIASTNNPAQDIAIAYALNSAPGNRVAVPERQWAEYTVTPTISIVEPEPFQTVTRDDHMTVILRREGANNAEETLRMPLWIKATSESDLQVCTAHNVPEDLTVTRLVELLYISLPNELEDDRWTEWEDFQYLRNQLQERLLAIATAALQSSEAGFQLALANHIGDFYTPLPWPEQDFTIKVKHHKGVITATFSASANG